METNKKWEEEFEKEMGWLADIEGIDHRGVVKDFIQRVIDKERFELTALGKCVNGCDGKESVCNKCPSI